MALSSDLISQVVQLTKKEKQSKETTVYGTIVEYNGRKYVKLDGSELLTPISTTADALSGERVTVMIKNHSAIVTGNLSSPSARTATVKELGTKITEVEILTADKVSTERLEAESGRIDTLVVENATIKDNIDANEASINALTANTATIEQRLAAAEADIKSLDTDKLDAEVANITYATITNLEAIDERVYNLEVTYGEFEELDVARLAAAEADIDNLEANKLDAATAEITYAKITDLNAATADIDNLESSVAEIDTLIFGSASGNTIQTSFANAVIAQLGEAQIKSAMIENISASKIASGDIITNNVHVRSEDGSLLISDETIQISDSARVRVQIGKDITGDYSINIWDTNGNLMFSEGGITDNAIKDAIIRNDMVSDTANISAHKLDIDTLFEVINDSTNTIKSTRVYLDDEAQTLDVAFKTLSTEVDELGTNVSSQGTQLSLVQGQIESKVWQSDIDTASGELTTQYTELSQKVDSMSVTAASYTSALSDKADSADVTEINDRVATLELSLSGLESSVSNTYATKTEVSEIQNEMDSIEVGGRNLLLNSKAFKGSNIICAATFATETYKDFKVRTCDASSLETSYVDMATFTNLYAEKLGSTYTLSFYAKGSNEAKLCTYFHGDSDYVRVSKFTQSDGKTGTASDGASYWSLTEDWQRYWVTWTLRDEGDISVKRHVLFRLWSGGNADICGVKLEKGSKATDWTPAPEDVDGDIATAQAAAETAQSTANQNAADMANLIVNFNSDIADLQTQIDGSITTWFYEVAPTSENAPAVNWSTTDDKNVHLGDLYYDTITGYCYRYQVANNVYSWQRITDTDVTKALSDAKNAQDTADQKRRVFYVQPVPPYEAGDLWVQGNDGDILRCQATKTSGQSYSSSDWIVASKYTDDTVANSAMAKANSAQQTADTALDDITNLKIGGRNLLKNSKGDSIDYWQCSGYTVVEDDTKGYCIECQNTTLKEKYIGSAQSPVVEPSAEYTFSADIWCNEYLTNFDFHWLSDTIEDPKPAGTYTNVRSKSLMTITPNVWTRVVWTFTTRANDRTGYFRIDNNSTIEEGTASILRVANLKFEKGNRATDWTPAPEDLEDRVTTAETKILQNDSSIASLVDRTTVVENKFTGYSTTEEMNSAITQSANSVVSSVSETYTTKTEFKNLEIGGRNLVAGTDETTEYVGNAAESTTGYKDVWAKKTIAIPTGTEYVVSFDAKADEAQSIQCFFYSPNTTTKSSSSTGHSSAGADGVSYVNITTDWARYWVKWTQTVPDAVKSIIVGRTFNDTDVYIRAVKFEEGHIPSAWTPAPEDMATSEDANRAQTTADSAQETADSAESLIKQLSDNIAMLVTDGNGTSLMSQTDDGWIFSTSELQTTIDATSEGLDTLINELGSTNSVVDVLKQAVDDLGVLTDYIVIGTYENEPCIELGETDSEFKLRITNTKVVYTEGSTVLAYFTNQSMHIKKAVIEEELQQGGFVWKVRSNGNMGLVWKG